MVDLSVNSFVASTASPAILDARNWLTEYDGSKGDRIDLSQAAPPYPPPQELVDRLTFRAGLEETARYGAVPGEYELRVAYATSMSKLYAAAIEPHEISITSGCNQAFLIAAMLSAKSGDTVLLPVPWYFNHKMTFDMLGVQVRAVPCFADNGFIPSLSSVEQMMDNTVRALVLVSPNNPTGSNYPPDLLDSFARLCRDRQIWLILDETYRDFLPEVQLKPHSIFDSKLRDNVISLYSFSKSFALPGYRLGAMIYPARISEHVIKVQDCVQICPARVGQFAVTWGIQFLDEWRRERRLEMSSKCRAFRSTVTAASGWHVESFGAYFTYVRHPYRDSNARKVAERLAKENGLLLIPGSYFGPGQEQYLRLSFGSLTPKSLASLPERLVLR